MIIQASGDLSRRFAPLSPKGKAFPQSAKTFSFSNSVIYAAGSVPTRRKCLPQKGRCRHCRRKRTLPSLSGKVAALPTEEVIAFPQFSTKLIFSPPSGKTFNDNSDKRKPLSALCATLPKGESFLFRHFCATLPEGESISAECEDFLIFRLGF